MAGIAALLLWSVFAHAQTGYHTILLNANQDADFVVTVGSKTYTKADAKEVEPNIKSGRPGDPFKGWEIKSAEPAKQYIVEFKPLQGFFVQSGGYNKTYEIPPGYDYFTYQTNIIYDPTEISVWASFAGAAWEEEKTLRAPFTIKGPRNYSGEVGVGGVFDQWKGEKVPWGEYTITWGAIPGYETPPPKTLMLSSETLTKEAGRTPQGAFFDVVSTGKITFNAIYQRKTATPPTSIPPPQAPSVPKQVAPQPPPIPAPKTAAPIRATQAPRPTEEQNSISPSSPPDVLEKPQGFFSRIWRAIISFFGRLF